MDDVAIVSSKPLHNIFIGDSLALQCAVNSSPNATYTWYHNGIMASKRSVIQLLNVKNSQGGIYTCVGKNKFVIKKKSVELSIQCKSVSVFAYCRKTSWKVYWEIVTLEITESSGKTCFVEGKGWYIEVFKSTVLRPRVLLAHFMLLISFDTPWKHQKTSGFLMFLGVIKIDQWHEMG